MFKYVHLDVVSRAKVCRVDLFQKPVLAGTRRIKQKRLLLGDCVQILGFPFGSEFQIRLIAIELWREKIDHKGDDDEVSCWPLN